MTGEQPIALVTNDDGIASEGLRIMATALTDEFEVIVAAPTEDRSGSGTGIGRFETDHGVRMIPAEIEGVPRAYAIDGPPGLAVTAAALGAFGARPDLVVSGINAGINTGHSIIHSGTVGAALTAHTFDIKGLAVSLAQSEPWQWGTAAVYGMAAARWLATNPKRPFILNVNIPGLAREEVRGVHWADLDEFGYFRVATADVEDRRLQLEVGPRETVSDPASDTILCLDGNVTITPLATVEPAPFPDVPAEEICLVQSAVSP